MYSMPRKSTPKPSRIVPTLLIVRVRPPVWRRKPRATAGRAYSSIFSPPNPAMDTSHAVAVVPTLLPIITPMDCLRVSRPALTRPMTMTVVAELDGMNAVTSTPTTKPM